MTSQASEVLALPQKVKKYHVPSARTIIQYHCIKLKTCAKTAHLWASEKSLQVIRVYVSYNTSLSNPTTNNSSPIIPIHPLITLRRPMKNLQEMPQMYEGNPFLQYDRCLIIRVNFTSLSYIHGIF